HALAPTFRLDRVPGPGSRVPPILSPQVLGLAPRVSSPESRVPFVMSGSKLLDELIDALCCLPGVGNKSAQRMAMHLLERERNGGRRLAAALESAMQRIGNCSRCRNFSEDPLC